MVIKPTRELTIDAYPDADFSGIYGHEKPTDPVGNIINQLHYHLCDSAVG